MNAPARATMPTPEPGVYRSMPAETYHSLDCASASRLKQLRRSPAHMKAAIDQPQADTPALIVGRAIHAAILEPDVFPTLFTVADECTQTKKSDGKKCTNGGVKYHPEFGWLCGVHLKGVPCVFDDSRTVLSVEDHAMCLAVRDSVHAHPAARALLGAVADTELTLIWDDEETGVRVKARLDAFAPSFGDGTIADVKSCLDASPLQFPRSFYSLGYEVQSATYLAGAAALNLGAADFAFIACEKSAPFAVVPYTPDESTLLYGDRQYHALLRRYAECRATDSYPSYSEKFEWITLPRYAWDQIDANIANLAGPAAPADIMEHA